MTDLFTAGMKKIMDDNKEYLDSRKNEIECIEHALQRYDSSGNFFGCVLCEKDRVIGTLIMHQNVSDMLHTVVDK